MKKQRSWVEENLEDYECNLCQMSDKKFLNYDGKPIVFHKVDRTILFLENALVKRSKSGVFLYPVENTDIVVSMCVDAIYALFDLQNDKDKVLLVSNNVEARQMYWNLRTDNIRINEFFPMGIVRLDGTLKKQLKTEYFNKGGTGCNFIHTSDYRILPNDMNSKSIGCVVVDTKELDKNAIPRIMDWAKKQNINSIIFLESDPSSENFKFFLSEGLPIWGWTVDDLKDDFKENLIDLEEKPEVFETPFASSVFHIGNVLGGIKYNFIEIKDENLIPTLNEALQLYFEIKKLSQENNIDVVLKAWRLYSMTKSAFEGMLAPLEYIENQAKQTFLAKTLQQRIQALEAWQDFLSKFDPYFGGVWAKTYSISKVIYHKFKENGNPKYEKIKKIIKEALSFNQRLLILNFSEPYSRALSNALSVDLNITEDDLVKKGIFITSSINKNISETYDKCIIFGAPNWWANWVLRLSCAKEIVFLIYPSEKALLKYQFTLERKKVKDYFTETSRTNFLKKVLEKEELDKMPQIKEPTKQSEISIVLTEAESKDEDKFNSLFKDLKTEDELIYETELEEPDEPEYLAVSKEGKIIVKCCKIDFESGSHIYFKPSRRLPVFKDGKKIVYLKVNNVKEGESMVIVKNSIKNNLAQEIIKKADKHPKMQRLKFLVNSWVIILRKGMLANKDSPKRFLIKLNRLQEDEKIAEVKNWITVQLWRDGYTIGPQNSKNIKLIGKIYNEPFLIDNYREVSAAISRLRGIHQTLLRRFNEFALRAGVKTISYTADEMLDEEFNLHLEDFAGMVSIEKIKSIDLNATAERSKLDRLIK